MLLSKSTSINLVKAIGSWMQSQKNYISLHSNSFVCINLTHNILMDCLEYRDYKHYIMSM